MTANGVTFDVDAVGDAARHPWRLAAYQRGAPVAVTYEDADGVQQKGVFAPGKAFLLTASGWSGELSLDPASPSGQYALEFLGVDLSKGVKRGR